MSPRKPDVGVTVFHALNPRECACADACESGACEFGECVAAAIKGVSALDAPGPARVDGDGDAAVVAARRRGAR